MKKIVVTILSFRLLLGIATSCGKTEDNNNQQLDGDSISDESNTSSDDIKGANVENWQINRIILL